MTPPRTCTGCSRDRTGQSAVRAAGPAPAGAPPDLVLNAAYLVEDVAPPPSAVPSTASLSPYIRVELTGPWAPYSFATLEEP